MDIAFTSCVFMWLVRTIHQQHLLFHFLLSTYMWKPNQKDNHYSSTFTKSSLEVHTFVELVIHHSHFAFYFSHCLLLGLDSVSNSIQSIISLTCACNKSSMVQHNISFLNFRSFFLSSRNMFDFLKLCVCLNFRGSFYCDFFKYK